jgi:hypothetical protein
MTDMVAEAERAIRLGTGHVDGGRERASKSL